MTKNQIAKAIERLDNLHKDTETNHWEADQILLECVPKDVADAYYRVIERQSTKSFWYA